MTDALAQEGLTGAVWALVIPDREPILGAAGWKQTRPRESMTADTQVHVGSIAKVALAVGVMRMITEGHLSLDTPLTDVLPELRFENPWGDTHPVRVRHLLAHTSGLDNARLWQVFSMKPTPHTPLAKAFQGSGPLLQIRTRPGSRYSYSNMGYALLGMVIESVTGQRYESYLNDHVLHPLGLRDSTFEFVTQVEEPRLAMGYFDSAVPQMALPMFLRPAGQFTTTAADMAVLARFLMGDGRIAGQPFVAESLLRALGIPFGTESVMSGLVMGHGLALAMRDRHGVLGVCHPGTTVGFNAMFCLYPDQGRAFFVAMNTDSETADYERFNSMLVQDLRLTRIPTVPQQVPGIDHLAWEGVYVPAPNNMEQFAWLDFMFNFMRVKVDGNQLRLTPLQSQVRTLVPVGGALFRATDRTQASHVFFTAEDGTRVLSDGLRHFALTPPWKLIVPWISLAAGMLGLVHVLLAGGWRMTRQRLGPDNALFAPFIGMALLLTPLPFFIWQSPMQMGDVTIASGLLVVVTAILPIALVCGLVVWCRPGQPGARLRLDGAALIAALQWALLLVVAGVLPLRLFA